MPKGAVGPSAASLFSSRIDPPICALGTSGDPEDDDQARGIIDHVDHAEIADTQPPELRPRELHRARRARLDRESENRAAQAGGIAWRKSAKLTLGGWRDLDSVEALAHASPGP